MLYPKNNYSGDRRLALTDFAAYKMSYVRAKVLNFIIEYNSVSYPIVILISTFFNQESEICALESVSFLLRPIKESVTRVNRVTAFSFIIWSFHVISHRVAFQ